MEQELVTIVVPIYNVEKYLNRCLNSVVNQTYRNLEIILVDDGSPDNCPAMCDAWAKKDDRIRVIHKENAGLGMARNTGITHASGQYICFFDSDDYVESDTIEKVLMLATVEKADVVIFGLSNVDKQGNIVRTFTPASEIICFRGKSVQEQFLPDLIDPRHEDAEYKNLCLSAWCCMFDMNLVRRTNWRFVSERQNISEDSYSLIWLYKYVNVVAVLPEAKYFYCENETSLTRTYRADRFDKIKQFYADTLQLAREQEYGHLVQTRIAGLFLSFTIAALKQVVISDMGFFQRMKTLDQILSDELLQQILRTSNCRSSSRARNVILWAMRSKVRLLVFLFLKAQASLSRK